MAKYGMVLVASLALFLSACTTTSSQKSAYAGLQTTAVVVYNGMKVYGAFVQQGKVDAATQVKVQQGYIAYQGAMNVAIVAVQQKQANAEAVIAVAQEAGNQLIAILSQWKEVKP